MHNVSVSMLPMLAEPSELVGHSAVMIDVLRASTTILHALSNQARCVFPFATIEDARSHAESEDPSTRLLGGERHCQRIEGFDLDNSPLSYESKHIAGKTVIFTTTNGTFALEKCRPAERVFVGAFNNLSAISRKLVAVHQPVHLVCAGTNRQLTAEDILFAGALVDRLVKSPHFQPGDVQAQMTLDFYRSRGDDPQLFRETIYESLGAENLIRLTMTADIERAMQIDRFDFVPEWNPESNSIVVSPDEC